MRLYVGPSKAVDSLLSPHGPLCGVHIQILTRGHKPFNISLYQSAEHLFIYVYEHVAVTLGLFTALVRQLWDNRVIVPQPPLGLAIEDVSREVSGGRTPA